MGRRDDGEVTKLPPALRNGAIPLTSTGILNRALPEGARSCRRSLVSEPEGQSGPLVRMRTGAAASNRGAMLSGSRRRRNSDEEAG